MFSFNNDIVLLLNRLFISAMNADLANRICTSNAMDKVVLNVLAAAKSGDMLPMKSTLADWNFTDGPVFYQKWCYILTNKNLCHDIVRQYHDP